MMWINVLVTVVGIVCSTMVITICMILVPGPLGLLLGIGLILLSFVGTFVYAFFQRMGRKKH